MGRGSTFGDRLRTERLRAGLSQRQLAAAVGVDHRVIGRLETGDCGAVMGTVSRIAAALGIAVADLVLDGDSLFEVEFNVGDFEPSTPPPWLERRLLAKIHGPAPVAVWPYQGDGMLRLRARASSLPELAALTGVAVDGITASLPPPSFRPVEATADLSVLLRQPTQDAAKEDLDATLEAANCSPRVKWDRWAGLWRARLRRVPKRSSLALQVIALTSPIGLFVPVRGS